MTAPANNLFQRLHKWASRQDENFLTESLAVVLEQLLALAPAVAVGLVRRLTDGFIDLPPESASAIELHTQVEAVQGRPDLEIRTPERLTWVEVKAESVLRRGQLEGYRVLLGQTGFAETQLILLTRYPEAFRSGDARPDLELRWYEVIDWLEDELPACEAAGEVAVFLARQLLDFLGERGMQLAQVGKFMPEGLRALTNLQNMLMEAARACKLAVNKSVSWEYLGLTLDGKYWFGVILAEPEKLWFGTERCQIDYDRATKLGVGEIEEAPWTPGRYQWWRGVELESEAAHFFSRTKIGQIRWLEEFLRDCLTKAHSIETPEQPPIPEITEEGSNP